MNSNGQARGGAKTRKTNLKHLKKGEEKSLGNNRTSYSVGRASGEGRGSDRAKVCWISQEGFRMFDIKTEEEKGKEEGGEAAAREEAPSNTKGKLKTSKRKRGERSFKGDIALVDE